MQSYDIDSMHSMPSCKTLWQTNQCMHFVLWKCFSSIDCESKTTRYLADGSSWRRRTFNPHKWNVHLGQSSLGSKTAAAADASKAPHQIYSSRWMRKCAPDIFLANSKMATNIVCTIFKRPSSLASLSLSFRRQKIQFDARLEWLNAANASSFLVFLKYFNRAQDEKSHLHLFPTTALNIESIKKFVLYAGSLRRPPFSCPRSVCVPMQSSHFLCNDKNDENK